MREVASFLVFVLLAFTTGVAEEPAAANEAAAKKPEGAQSTPAEADAQGAPLEELEWMIGTWIDKADNSAITTTCSWTKNRKFLTRSFTVAIDGKTGLEGTQVIGWDPIAGRIRSWTFDSEGGFGEGRWIRDGNRWLVKTSFVLATGERASSVNVITYVDQDTLRWQSVDREIGGDLLPNIPEITVVRQRPDKTQQTSKTSEVPK